MIDFTNCIHTKKTYAGANGGKRGIIYNEEKYMLKFPSKPTKNKEMSYSNSCISEYIGCHIYKMLDIPVQETILGIYTNDNINKTQICVACKDIEQNGYVLKDFGSLKNTIIDSIHQGYGTELKDILECIENQQYVDILVLKQRFWDMFIVDSLIGNFDRHNGNWGFLYNNQTDDIKLAPVYDCGSCLYPQADKDLIKNILCSEKEKNNRIYNFPTSAIKENNSKINYYTFLQNTENIDCINSLLTIFPKIDLHKISEFINNIEEIDDLQKSFYITMLDERYKKILEPAYEKVKNLISNDYQEDNRDYKI